MDYVLFENERDGVLVVFNGKEVVNWTAFDKTKYVGTFHDNSPIDWGMVGWKCASAISEKQAIDLLIRIAESTTDTAAHRYSREIQAFVETVVFRPFLGE